MYRRTIVPRNAHVHLRLPTELLIKLKKIGHDSHYFPRDSNHEETFKSLNDFVCYALDIIANAGPYGAEHGNELNKTLSTNPKFHT